MRYIWSAFLLIAAVLAPSATTAIILVLGGIITMALAFSREQKVATMTAELSDVLAIKRKSSSIALERSLAREQRLMLVLAILGELIIFIALLTGNLDITVARNYALLVLVALAPIGLEIELSALLRTKQKHGSETVRTAIGYAIEDAQALLAIVALSFIGTVFLQIPPALTALQLLFIICIARPLLSGRALQALPHKIERPLRVELTALLVYGSYLFFYVRHYIDPRYADAANPLVWQATTVAFASFIVCQVSLLLLTSVKLPVQRLLALVIAFIAVVYVGGIQDNMQTAGISASDFVWILATGSSFTALYLLFGKVKTLLQ